jgi:hypothetical protein
MCEALSQARGMLDSWLVSHSDCFPPIVINISDGEPTDGDPTQAAKEVQSLSSTDGPVLLFNLHISSQRATPIEFPDNEEALPDDHARLLFRMASLLPPYLGVAAKQEGISVSDGSKAFVFNADLVSVIKFLDIGTRPSNLR